MAMVEDVAVAVVTGVGVGVLPVSRVLPGVI